MQHAFLTAAVVYLLTTLISGPLGGAISALVERSVTGHARFEQNFRLRRLRSIKVYSVVGTAAALLATWALGGFAGDELRWFEMSVGSAIGAAVALIIHTFYYRSLLYE